MPNSISQRTKTKFDKLRRIVCIGRDARYTRAIVELAYPSEGGRRKLIIVERDMDVNLLRDYRPEELCYIPMSPTAYQRDFLATRRHEYISLEEAGEWLKTR